MGVEDLSPEQDKTIGGYCMQDVDLTYAAYKRFNLEFPMSERAVIDVRSVCLQNQWYT